jgi:hypothetical protein
MAITDEGKEAQEVPCCEYAKAEGGFGEFGLSIRRCGNQTCPQSIFGVPTIYEKCPYRLEYQKCGVAVAQVEPKKVFVRTHSKQESVPKFTGASCNGCQYKAGSYCWGQCTLNVWKRKPDW